jgi:hypothetical protein
MAFQFRKEAIEEDLNSNFPSQGQGNPPLYYSLSEVVVPTYSINNVAEGSSLPEMLQTAWDFSTGLQQINGATPVTIINNTGFWLVDITTGVFSRGSIQQVITIELNDGVTQKPVWEYRSATGGTDNSSVSEGKFVVFLRSGDSLQGSSTSTYDIPVWYRQIADVNGTLVNPLGFSFA